MHMTYSTHVHNSWKFRRKHPSYDFSNIASRHSTCMTLRLTGVPALVPSAGCLADLCGCLSRPWYILPNKKIRSIWKPYYSRPSCTQNTSEFVFEHPTIHDHPVTGVPAVAGPTGYNTFCTYFNTLDTLTQTFYPHTLLYTTSMYTGLPAAARLTGYMTYSTRISTPLIYFPEHYIYMYIDIHIVYTYIYT